MSAPVQDNTRKVLQRSKAGSIKSVGRAAAYVRGIAQRSISKRKDAKPSPPGKPPRSPTGRLRGAIAFNVDKSKVNAVIGPTRSRIGRIGHTHEFGGQEPPKHQRGANPLRVGGVGPVRVIGKKPVFGKLKSRAQVDRAKALIVANKIPPSVTGAQSTKPRTYPARPFMGPALERSRDRLPAFWRNSLKEG